MKRAICLLLVCCLLLCGCYSPYDGYEAEYFGFVDNHILGYSYDEIVAYYGLPQERYTEDDTIVYLDDDNRIRYTVRNDYKVGKGSRDAYVYITFNKEMSATAWTLSGNTDQNSTGFGLSQYAYDLVWMTGKTAPEIRARYGFFHYEEYNDVQESDPLIDTNVSYILHKGDIEIAKADEILLHVYFNSEGVATRFCEQYGYIGG